MVIKKCQRGEAAEKVVQKNSELEKNFSNSLFFSKLIKIIKNVDIFIHYFAIFLLLI
jgi:hypothetical protein